jgi:hypothetical protein
MSELNTAEIVKEEEKLPETEPAAETSPADGDKKPKKKKKQKEWRRLKTIAPMTIVIPYIMTNRVGSQNFIRDSVEVERLEKYMKEKQLSGMTNISMMHIMIAIYIRLVSQRPALNRFIRGQRVWTRRNVEVSLNIKREMTLDSPDTVVKITLPPNATLQDVYEALNDKIVSYRANPGGDFDKVAKLLTYMPGLIFKGFVGFIRFLDYFGLCPKLIREVSPFHCSYFITSMGSLGIPPIYHHLYDFGTCPVFFSFGAKRRAYEIDKDGVVKKKQYIDFTFVTDERICDGFYFASALKLLKNICKNPWQLDEVPEVIPDID